MKTLTKSFKRNLILRTYLMRAAATLTRVRMLRRAGAARLVLATVLTLLCSLTAGAEEVINYDLWLGEKRVTSANKDNILDQVDDKGEPTAKFDPATTTLTLNNPNISGEYNGSRIHSDIKNFDLTIQGCYHATGNDYNYGIRIYGNLILKGTFTFRG